LEVFFWVALALDIAFHHLPVATLPNCGNVLSIGPKFSTPQFALDCRPPSKDFSGGHTLKPLHNPPRRYFGMGTAEHMNVILVCLERFHFNGISFFDTDRSLLDNFGYFLVQKSFPVLDRKDNRVRDLPRTVGTLLYFICRFGAHTSRGYQNKRTP